MIINMFDPLDDSIVHFKYNTVFVAIHDEDSRSLVRKTVPARFHLYDANRRPENLIEDFRIPCFARFFDQGYFDSIADELMTHLATEVSNIPNFVLGKCKSDFYKHPELYFIGDEYTENIASVFIKSVKHADTRFQFSNDIETNPFAFISISDEKERDRIIALLDSNFIGWVWSEPGDDNFSDTIVGRCFIRFIDARTLRLISDELLQYFRLVKEIAPFIVLGDNVLPFSHPLLFRMCDVKENWIIELYAKAAEANKTKMMQKSESKPL
jgi:hypothetical protein